MIVRRLAARGVVRRGSTEKEPRRRRASRYLLIIFSAGALTGVASLLGVWPFGGVHALVDRLLYSSPSQIAASTIFPPVPPVHQVVNVYDPPPASRSSAPKPPATGPTSPPRGSSASGTRTSPRPAPPPDE